MVQLVGIIRQNFVQHNATTIYRTLLNKMYFAGMKNLEKPYMKIKYKTQNFPSFSFKDLLPFSIYKITWNIKRKWAYIKLIKTFLSYLK